MSMIAGSSRLGWLGYVDESVWGEDVTTMTSPKAIPFLGPIDFSSLRQAMIANERTAQYKQGGFANIVGPWDNAEFSFDIYLKGFESSTAGAGLALTDHHNFVGWFIGNVALSAAAGTTASGTGGGAHLATTTAANGFVAGSLGRAGVLGDARGNGQWFVAASHAANTLTMLNALDAATISTDVIYSAATISTKETTNDFASASKRFLAMSADFQAMCHGCFPKAYSFTGGAPGEALKMRCTVGVSWARPRGDTFPSVTLPPTTNPAPAGAGSFFLQDRGTVTRPSPALTLRQFGIAVTAGIVPVMGYNGVNPYQVIVGARRTSDQIIVSATLDGEGPDSTPRWYDAWGTNTPQHGQMAYSTADGTALSCYFPNLFWRGDRPMQVDFQGCNGVPIQFDARTGLTVTTELTASAMRWGFG